MTSKVSCESHAQGIRRFFITDDNFARNTEWETLFDRMIALRQEGLDIGLTIQVDTLCHRIPRFIDKAAQAGVRRVFIGLENINPDNLLAAKKRQNKITEYREMLQKWRAAGAITYAGYIIGFPADTKESILRDIDIIKRELPLDILELFFLTPLPGSEDHKRLLEQGVWMDPDLNKYDLNHRVSHHAVMSDTEWEEAYREAWKSYYSPEHVRTIIRRAAATQRGRPGATMRMIVWFYSAILFEGVHPLESGAFRLKHRKDRRLGMQREDPITFYSRYFGECVRKFAGYLKLYLRLRKVYKDAVAAPDRWSYTDLAMETATDELDTLDLFQVTSGGQAARARKRRDDAIRAAPAVLQPMSSTN